MYSLDKKSFPEREETILNGWQASGIFSKSLSQREGSKTFSFYDGPPFATGLPHYGHLLAGTIKDVVPRYKTMKGFYVPRRFGWDCHGLPVENEIEKARELSGSAAIEDFGIAAFNEECRSIVLRFTEEWKRTVNRMGRWVDFEKTYKTMDPSFMESVWWVFSQLWEKDLVYKGYKVMPFSAKLGTPLSNFEANLNYQDVDDPSVFIRMPIEGEENTSALIWTTTPWTLPSNLAICVSPKITYVKVAHEGELYYLAKSRVAAVFKEEVEIVEELSGADLAGKKYVPPFGYFSSHENAFSILSDEFVGDEDGTGIVHMAPAFGEQDFFVCQKANIEAVCPVNQNGQFTGQIPEYEGLFVKDADKEIMKRLKGEGRVFRQGTIRHRYPFCWRSNTPLIYKAVDTWFVSVESLKERLIANNQEIHWVPDHVKDGRFGKWLEGARDWAISRNRYWGTPIPIWQAEDGTCMAVGSVEELEKLSGKKVDDLHRHFIDDISFEKDGKTFKRVSEVFDCWFESGSMPYAQNHYPFDNKEQTEENFPADFIGEGLDQTRGWFYTLNILSTALFDKPAFKNVIVNGIILAEDGNKMSKSLKNYPDPHEVIDKYGADAIRLFLLNSPAVEGDDLKFSERGVELVLRQVLIPLWNSYFFFGTYANIYSWNAQEFTKPSAEIDRWILSRLQKLIGDVEEGMDSYQLAKAVQPLVGFIDELTNWYIRRCRPRFWSEEDSQDRRDAFTTLHYVLKELCKVIAPFIPFISDSMYQQLTGEESVHLCDYPTVDESLRDKVLEEQMELAQAAVSMGHSLRKEHKQKVRQPLPAVHLVAGETVLEKLREKKELVADELNVKEVFFHTDEGEFVTYTVKPNFKTLGKKAGKDMKGLKSEIENFDDQMIRAVRSNQEVSLTVNGNEHTLSAEDFEVVRSVKEDVIAQSDGSVTVALDTALDDNLIREGLAREIVNKVNTMRRNNGFEVTDRISLTIQGGDPIPAVLDEYQDYIAGEVLAHEVACAPCSGEAWDLNGIEAVIAIEKREVTPK